MLKQMIKTLTMTPEEEREEMLHLKPSIMAGILDKDHSATSWANKAAAVRWVIFKRRMVDVSIQ